MNGRQAAAETAPKTAPVRDRAARTVQPLSPENTRRAKASETVTRCHSVIRDHPHDVRLEHNGMNPHGRPGDPIEQPLDIWLYEAKPKPGCHRCAELKVRLDTAKSNGNAIDRFEAARSIRNCEHEAAK